MRTLITICGRGGSKGIPGKNIKLLNNKPLLCYTIDHAKEFSSNILCDIALSTDSHEIKKIAKYCGIETDYLRPAELSTDTAGKIDVIQHLLKHEETKRKIKYDLILDLDISSPMRTVEDLKMAYTILKENDECLNLFSVSEAEKNPYFNMVERGERGFYKICKSVPGGVASRQTAPKVFELNASFYFYRRAFFDEYFNTPFTSRSLVYVMTHVCFDLDNMIDFEFLEFLLLHNKLSFKI